MAQPVDLVLVSSDQSYHVASVSSNAGGFSVWCPPGIFAHLTRHNDRLHARPDPDSAASFIEYRPPFPDVEHESLATVRITDLSDQSFLPGAHAYGARTLTMDALEEPFDLVVGWARRDAVDRYITGIGGVSNQTYAAGDRTIVFSQVRA